MVLWRSLSLTPSPSPQAALQDNAPEVAARIKKVADVFKPVVDHPGPYMEVFNAEELSRKIIVEVRLKELYGVVGAF